MIDCRLFGGFDVRIDSRPLPPLRSRREQWLLALLILRHDRETAREWLAETIWPDNDEQQALFYLRKSLSNLRKALGSEAVRILSPTPRTLRLGLDEAFVDVVLFDTMIQQTLERRTLGDPSSDSVISAQESALSEAVALYRGPLLPDCLEEWAVVERSQREEAYQSALESLAGISCERGEPAAAVHWLRRLIASDSFRESAYCTLMRALSDCGDLASLKQVYGDLRAVLRQELNASPSPETEALYDQLMHRDVRGAPLAAPNLDSAPSRRHLPVPLSELIGRQDEIADILDLMRSRRLISLVGAGGIGKTRLAIAVAERALPQFEHGVWFADLAPLSDPALVINATAKALGIGEEQRRPLTETLPETLASQSLLLVLDNCEHLNDAAASVAQLLLVSCPSMAIIATSRQALDVIGEQIVRVPSLPVPPAETIEQDNDPHALLDYEAARLFVDRARHVDGQFRLNSRNASGVIGICRSLDGIPLAIEMAAARLRSLSVGEIESRLADRFRLLTTGSRVSLPRQQTLRATIDWSYDLLSDSEKALFCRLSVFAGGCTLKSAEAICDVDLLDILASLVDKSLVAIEVHDGVTRYRMLETVRQYASDRLAESGEADAWRERHLAHFLALAEEAEPHLVGREEQVWQERLEIEHDNLRAALAWATEEDGEPESAQRICGALLYFWLGRGYLGEGRGWCRKALEWANHRIETKTRAATLHCAGRLAYAQGDYVTARPLFEESLSISRELQDAVAVAQALNGLGIMTCDQGDYDSAISFHELSLTIRRELGDPWTVSQSLNNLGVVETARGDYSSAHTLLQESLSIRRRIGVRRGTAIVLHSLSRVAFEEGDYASAHSLQEESLCIRREVVDLSGIAESLMYLGNVAYQLGNFAHARSLYNESLSIWRTLRVREGLALLLDSFADLAMVQAEPLIAARLWGAAESLREEFGGRLWLGEQYRRDAKIAAARKGLGDDAAFQAAWSAGRAMSVDEANACVLGM